MKKIIAIILTLVLTCTLFAACGSSQEETDTATTTTESALEKVKNAGKLSIATSPDFEPFEYYGDNNEIIGIEIDILNKVCEKLGVELEINAVDFESVLPGIQARKFDLGASGITVTEKRKENALFTDVYCLAAQAIVVTEGSDITCKADLEGKKISVQTGTTAESFCMESGYDVSAFTANSDAQAALTTGKVDAWVIDDLTAAKMVDVYNAQGGDQLVILSEAMTTEPYAFALSLDSEDLVAEINTVIQEMLADGSIEAIFANYNAPYTAPEED